MGLVVAPIPEGKLEEWKKWNADLNGSMKDEFAEFNRRYGLTRHDVWLVHTPSGPAAVVLHEGPGGDTFMPKLAQAENEFDVFIRQKIEYFHDMDLSKPPPGPMPVKMV